MVSAVDVIDVEAFNESNLAGMVDLDHEQKLAQVEAVTPPGTPPSLRPPAGPTPALPAISLQPNSAHSTEVILDFGEVEAKPASQPTAPDAEGGEPKAAPEAAPKAAPKARASASKTGAGQKTKRARPDEVTFTPHHSPSPTHGPLTFTPSQPYTQVCEYEQQRLDNIKENQEKLANLGLGSLVKQKPKKPKKVSNPVVSFALTPTLGVCAQP